MRSYQYLAPLPDFDYVTPLTKEELFDAMDFYGRKGRLLAGGTDILLALKSRTLPPASIIDLSRLRSLLGGIVASGDSIRIGSLATFAEIESDPFIRKHATALSLAASAVGTLQIRNMATIGGNLATTSPAADSAPPLIALGGSVTLLSRSGQRTIPVQNFFVGPKVNSLLPGEAISHIHIPVDGESLSHWTRVAARKDNAVSLVSVAVATSIRGGRFGPTRIALGSVAPTPILAESTSKAMTGGRTTPEEIDRFASLASGECSPITDIRASADYRKHLVHILVRRTISHLVEEAGEI